jgi:hypothetical protein
MNSGFDPGLVIRRQRRHYFTLSVMHARSFSPLFTRIGNLLPKPVGRVGRAVVTVLLVTAPALMFFDPAELRPGRGHVARDPSSIYILYSDDIAYVSASRTLASTFSNLFVPHNTHIVPAWRLLTWALVTLAGSLERLPQVLAVASYSILVAVMLLTGRLVARETGRSALGYVAMVMAGTTSLMLVPVTWYSAGQPLWAGFGVLAVLWFAQSFRRTGRWRTIVLAALAAPVAGWLWSAGHVAGPVAAVYLWVDGRRPSRLAAAALMAVTFLTVAFTLVIGGRLINQTISFHGRRPREAAAPLQGLLHTGQAITENLALGNLGLTVQTTQTQGALLSSCVFLLWSSRWWLRLIRPAGSAVSAEPKSDLPRFQPLECAGAALVLSGYLIVWTFRGLEDFQFLRTMNLRVIVPWYDVMPQIGFVLFLAGWWSATRLNPARRPLMVNRKPLTWLGTIGVGSLVTILIALNQPKVDFLVRESVPPLLPAERELFRIERLQTMRANIILLDDARRQRAFLRRLDRCQDQARRLGIGRHDLRAAFGHRWLPGTRVPLIESMYDEYDAMALLELPDAQRNIDPASVRARFAEYFVEDPALRLPLLAADVRTPPPSATPAPK